MPEEAKTVCVYDECQNANRKKVFFLPGDFACRDFDFCDLFTVAIRINN